MSVQDFSKLKGNNNYKSINPRNWNCIDYTSYLYNSGVAGLYYDFFNCINIIDNKSVGFRPPSIDISRSWAIEKKFLVHSCYKHKGERHSKLSLDEKYPTATWVCPETGWKTQIPHRYTNIGSYIPITFDIEDREKGITEILDLGYKARIWHFEMSIFDNKFRGENIFPDHLKIHTQGEKWDRVVGHNLIMEFDTTNERIDGENIRRDIMEEGDNVIENAQKIIDITNNEMTKNGIEAYEWWFSGGGIYFLLNYRLSDITRKGHGNSNLTWFNSILYKWDKYQSSIIMKRLEDERVKYIDLDHKAQFIRSYLKAPYSLHRKFDRIVLPLTGLFGGNDKIDLRKEAWRHYIYPKNIDKEFIRKVAINI